MNRLWFCFERYRPKSGKVSMRKANTFAALNIQLKSHNN